MLGTLTRTERAVEWWRGLERGWQAACLGLLLVCVVGLGVPIP